MEPSFWQDRWREGRIAFHEGKANRFLARHRERIAGARRVLVPLCGKSEDLAFLAAHGHEVVGVELVDDAVRAFFAEHGLAPDVEAAGPITAYRAGAVTILSGDFFAVTRAHTGAIDGFYDRAALIALPPPLRPRYAAHLRALLPAHAPGVLVTLDYDQARMDGPPFSVPDDEVRRHFAGAAIEQLEESGDPGGRAGDVGALERVYAVS